MTEASKTQTRNGKLNPNRFTSRIEPINFEMDELNNHVKESRDDELDDDDDTDVEDNSNNFIVKAKTKIYSSVKNAYERVIFLKKFKTFILIHNF